MLRAYGDVAGCAKALVHTKGTVEPDRKVVSRHNGRYDTWRRIYPALRGVFQEIVERAPPVIQDIGDHRFDRTYRTDAPTGRSFVLAYHQGLALYAVRDGRLELPRLSDWGADAAQLHARYLFAIGDSEFFLADCRMAGGRGEGTPTPLVADPGEPDGPEVPAPAGFSFAPIREFRFLEPRWMSFAAITGYHLWTGTATTFCGVCGGPLRHVATSRELACPQCSNVVYRISPAVIVGVTDGDRIVLTKHARARVQELRPRRRLRGGGRAWRTASGEVMEEVGLHVGNIRYYKSQPWPFTQTVLGGYFCDVEGDSHITLDRHELKLGRWFDRKDLPLSLPDTSSLTNEMICAFARGDA